MRNRQGRVLEPTELAYPRKADVDRTVQRLLERGLASDAYVAGRYARRAMIDRAIALGRPARPLRACSCS